MMSTAYSYVAFQSPLNFQRSLFQRLAVLIACVLGVQAMSAQARVIWVGDSPECEAQFIQNAIQIAANSFGPDEIRITKDHPDGSWYNQALTIVNGDLTIGANWDFCGQPDASYQAGYQTVSAFNRAAPVLTIRGSSKIFLYGMKIFLGAPPANSGKGGGIDFQGSGTLTLRTMQVANNTGDLGGGILVKGNIALRLYDNVYITENTARSGGGLYMSNGASLAMNAPYTFFQGNSATSAKDGYGGAIYIEAPSTARISSPDPTGGSTGVFYANSAVLGGGAIFVASSTSADTVVDLYSESGAEPLSFIGNSANNGSAIGVLGDSGVCATNIYVSGNVARPGASIGLAVSVAAGARYDVNTEDCFFRQPSSPNPPCGSLDVTHCNVYSNNTTTEGVFGATLSGAIELNRVRVTGNSSQRALFNAASTSQLVVLDSVIDNNQVAQSLVRVSELSSATLSHVTAADNVGLALASFENANSSILVLNSIFDQTQPVLSSVVQPGNNFIAGLLAPNLVGVPEATINFVGSPAFEPGYYRLRSNSPGVDFVNAENRPDADGNPRNIDNVDVLNLYGPGDVGAYESQATSNPPIIDRIFMGTFEPL
jgi:hypothetical protein